LKKRKENNKEKSLKQKEIKILFLNFIPPWTQNNLKEKTLPFLDSD
jgi:hypothetical protein